MPKITEFPKTISVSINTDGGDDDHFLSADTDASGAPFAEQGEKVKVGIYQLVETREVELAFVSNPVK